MSQPLGPDATADAIEEELAFLEVMVQSLDQGADDYHTKLAEIENQRQDYERRLEELSTRAQGQAGPSNMGMDGNNDFWAAAMGGKPIDGSRVPGGSVTSPNGLKRSLNGGALQGPSKRPTPDPSNAGTPTSSSTDSFEWVDHPQQATQHGTQSASQVSKERARQQQAAAEAAMKRRRETQLADEQFARQLSQPQNQARTASPSSSGRPVQTTLNHQGSYSKPVPPPPRSVLSPTQEQQLRDAVRPHGHPTPNVKPEHGPSIKQQPSPLARRPKPPQTTGVVDLTLSDSDSDDDVSEVAPSAFSPSNRVPRPPGSTPYQNGATTNPNNLLPPPQYGYAPPARQSMPGAWPNAVQVPSSSNGYVYNNQQQSQPGWLQNSNLLGAGANAAVSTAYNGMRALTGGFEDKMAELHGMIQGSNTQPFGTGDAGRRYADDDDDDIVFGGSRVLGGGPGQPQPYDGYANQQAYRDRFDEIMNQNPAKTMEEINALMENIRPDEDTPEHLRIKTPEQMSIELHKYQELGLTWLQRTEDSKSKGGILADDMGLGKTIQMLSLLVTHKSTDHRCKTTLIVAPVALMRQWKQEIETKIKPRHRLSVYIHHGQGKKKDFNDLRHWDVVLTTYGSLAAELKKLESFTVRQRFDPAARPRPNEKCALLGEDAKWFRVVLDEAQCIKNNSTQTAKAACRLNAQFRFCMTGTPMMNNVDELWSLIHFLRIKPYCDRHHFQRDFSKRLKSERTREDAMKSLQALIRSIMLRRTKQSKFEGKPILVLPERSTEIDHPVFSEDEGEFYKALETRSALQFNKYLKNGTVGSSYSAILVLLLRLRQACCHPHLIKDFGVSAAAGVSPDTLIELAKTLEPTVVQRIKDTSIANQFAFECPVCYDAVPNPAIFIPCGHDTCQECFAKIADNAARNGEGSASAPKCPACRGEINAKKITDFESFKKVHMPEVLSEEEQAELENMKKELQGSDTDDDSSDSETEDGDDVNSNGDLDDFIVNDDVEEFETSSVKGEDVKDEEVEESDGPSAKALVKTDKGKGKEAVKDKKVAKPNKGKGKKKGKKEKREKKPKKKTAMTMAELKKQATRSAKGRQAYIKKLAEDWVTSAKIEKTMERLKEIMENPEGEKVLIFSQWTSLLDLLEVAVYREAWGYRRYDGSMNAIMRADAVDDFTDTTKDVRMMLISLKAGNAGLNLNIASQVIILDPFWNPYIEEQAIDRAHRIGQRRPVIVHRMLIEGTVEDRIIALQEKKRELIGNALDEKASQNIARLGAQELAYLFGVTRNPNQRVQYQPREGRA